MKKFSLVSICALFLLGSVSTAQAVPVTINGTTFNISTIMGSFNDNSALLMSQPWWGSSADAGAFSEASFNAGINTLMFADGFAGTAFAYDIIFSEPDFVAFRGTQGITSGQFVLEGTAFLGANSPIDGWAVADLASSPDPVAVPEPASAMLLMLGLAGFVATKRKGKQAAS